MNIYLDYQATTPLAPEVYDAMQPWLKNDFANPHSMHKMGRTAGAAIEVAREQVNVLMPTGRVIFTSGATEALNQAIIGSLTNMPVNRDKIITLPTEHAAVLDVLRYIEKYGVIDSDANHRHFELIMAPIQSDGIADLDHMAELINDRTALVAAMLVNNEIGVIQPIEAIADMAHDHGALMLCDIVQGYGRVPIPHNIDLAAISAHKIFGPKGIGALWIKEGLEIASLIHGGGQEQGLRSGTLSPALCAGFGQAAELMQDNYRIDGKHINDIWDGVMPLISDWSINGSIEDRYGGNLNMRMNGLDVARLMSDLRYISFSAGSACASGSGRPSHVLEAIGLYENMAKNSIRIGFGRYSNINMVSDAIAIIDKTAKEQISEI